MSSNIVLMSDRGMAAIPVWDGGENLVDVRTTGLQVKDRKQDEAGAFAYVRQQVLTRLLHAQSLLPIGVFLLFVEGYRPPALQRCYCEDYSERLGAAHPDWQANELGEAAHHIVSPPESAPHTAGAAVDVTLVDHRGRELDMGTRVNASPEESGGTCYTDAPGLSDRARTNRSTLKAAMSAAGLINHPTEWWHWSFGDRYWALQTGRPAAVYGPVQLPHRHQPASRCTHPNLVRRPEESNTVSPVPSACGTRLPVQPASRTAYTVLPGVAGMAYRTLICALNSHDEQTEHAAIARPLHPPQARAVWAHWGNGAPSHAVHEACQLTGRLACALFAGHPGLCSPAFANTPSPDATRVKRIGDALAVLDQEELVDPQGVWKAAHDAALLTWDELRAWGVWEQLRPWDQAAVCWTISQVASLGPAVRGWAAAARHLASDVRELTGLWDSGRPVGLPGGGEAATLWELFALLPQAWQTLVLGDHRVVPLGSVPLDTAIRDASAQAAAGHAPPEPGSRDRSRRDDEKARKRGAEEATRLARLSYGWRVDGIRRAVLGRGKLSAGSAVMAINTLTGYGISLQRT
ncbi:M15 family metallopeptidase [Streptomyces sp. NPDC001414]